MLIIKAIVSPQAAILVTCGEHIRAQITTQPTHRALQSEHIGIQALAYKLDI